MNKLLFIFILLTPYTTLNAQHFGFTGYYFDEDTGLYYAKSRYYDPQTGRFLTEDPHPGNIQSSPSLHRYTYSYANPTTFVDPDGRFAESGHYYTVLYTAKLIGYNNADAKKLAYYAQLPDEVDQLDATNVQIDRLGSPGNLGHIQHRDLVQQAFHSLTGAKHGQNETNITIDVIKEAKDDLAITGLLLHRLGDTFAHREL